MPAFLTGPLLKYGIIALVAAALGATIYVQHLKLQTAAAQHVADVAALAQAATANKGLTDQVTSLTADAKTAADQAAAAEKALADRNTQAAVTVAATDQEIDHDATSSDDVCSPALASALGLVCPQRASADDHAAAAH